MDKTKTILIITIIIVLCGVIGLTYVTKRNSDSSSTNIVEYDSADDISTEEVTSQIDEIDWSTASSSEISLSGNLEITEAGTYTLTGTISNGQIKINTSGNVKLILNGVNITNQSGPAIYVENADNVEIYTVVNTTNTLTDGASYSNYDEDVNACIYSKDDLILSGEGTLKINANYMDAIVSKDDLKIASGTYIINSKDDGIRGKDSVEITGGTFTITAGADGIKSTNDTDTTKGFILISGGKFTITATNDGIQAETKLVITDGTFDIKTGSGSSNASTKSGWGTWGSSTTATSAKGIKAGDNIVISGGTFTLNTSDDAIHSNNYVGIKGGTFTVSSGDDGIHADSQLIIDNGTVTISKSYEGLEASKVTINGGTINITASDDGINVAGGNDSSAMNRAGANSYAASTSNTLTINGGTVNVNSTGDGLDANGSIYITGGTIYVDGPTDNGNGALDYDGECKITGGTLITAGSSGMAQNASSSSTQTSVLINFSSSYSANTKISITDESGNEIIAYTPSKAFQSILISTSKMSTNKTYKVLVNGSEYATFTTSSTITTVGQASMMGGNTKQPNGQTGQGNRTNGQTSQQGGGRVR